MQEIQRNDIAESIQQNGPLILVEVLPPDEYEKGHLPSAINVPLGEQFEETFSLVVPDKDSPVVVYCASKACDASPKAAKRLEKMGYGNVMDYSGGKKDWSDAGLRLVQTDH